LGKIIAVYSSSLQGDLPPRRNPHIGEFLARLQACVYSLLAPEFQEKH